MYVCVYVPAATDQCIAGLLYVHKCVHPHFRRLITNITTVLVSFLSGCGLRNGTHHDNLAKRLIYVMLLLHNCELIAMQNFQLYSQ